MDTNSEIPPVGAASCRDIVLSDEPVSWAGNRFQMKLEIRKFNCSISGIFGIMKNFIRNISIFLLVFLFTGCGTIQSLRLKDSDYQYVNFRCCPEPTISHNVPYIYSGMKYSLLVLTDDVECAGKICGPVVMHPYFDYLQFNFFAGATDVILSTAVDSVILPYTIYGQFTYGYIVDPPYFRLGEEAKKRGEVDQAIEYYEKGLNVLPKYFKGRIPNKEWIQEKQYLHLGELYKQKEDFEKATSLLLNCLCHLSQVKEEEQKRYEWYRARAYILLGEIGVQTGRIDIAIDYYNKIRQCCPSVSAETLAYDIEEFQGIRDQGLECRLEISAPGFSRDSYTLWIWIQNTSALKTYYVKDIYLEWCEQKYPFISPDGKIDMVKPKQTRYARIPFESIKDCKSAVEKCYWEFKDCYRVTESGIVLAPDRAAARARRAAKGPIADARTKKCYYPTKEFSINGDGRELGRVVLSDGSIIQTVRK